MYLAGLSQSCVVNTASQPSLRERMTRNLQLRGLGACTQEAYLQAVRQLAAFYRPTPNQFNEEQLREYFLRLKNHSTYSKSVRCPFSRSNGGVFVTPSASRPPFCSDPRPRRILI